MKKRKASIDTLLQSCEIDLRKIEEDYKDSLHQQRISASLQVKIKNFSENLRSVLDYIAHDIRETHCPVQAKPRFYFPILGTKLEFEAKVKDWYPALDTKAPDLWKYLESIQPYQKGWVWIGIFNRINSENKHGNLVAQTRTETEQVRVSFSGGNVSWIPQNVKFGPGVFIGGVPVDPGTQMPVPHPSQTVEKITWVDFQFDGENISALGLLKQVFLGVSKIVADVQRWL